MGVLAKGYGELRAVALPDIVDAIEHKVPGVKARSRQYLFVSVLRRVDCSRFSGVSSRKGGSLLKVVFAEGDWQSTSRVAIRRHRTATWLCPPDVTL